MTLRPFLSIAVISGLALVVTGCATQSSSAGIYRSSETQREQTVRLAGRDWRFAAEEPLITEYSVKYNEAAFTKLAQAAGWHGAERWTDPSGQVALVRLVPASDEPPATPSPSQ